MSLNKRILFLVDHKHRDLPSLSLIGYLLQKKGYDVKYNAIWLENDIIKEFDPGYIVLPKPVYAIDRLIKFKLDGRQTIVINTEGNPQDIKLALNIPMPPNLFFFWNETQFKLDQKILNDPKIELSLAGCPRMDFLTGELYQSIFPSKHQLLNKYNLSDKNKTITIATSCQDAHFDEKLIQQKEKIRKKKFRETAEYRDIVYNMRNLREKTGEIIKGLVETFPDINIILKPHPNENITYWEELISLLNTKKIFLCLGDPIYHLLKVSDLHISYNVCTTTYEAMMTGIPVVELHTKNSKSFYSSEHLYLADFIIKSFDDLHEKVNEILVKNKFTRDQIKNDQLKKYTDKYLFKVDGNRCVAYANKIDSFISKSTLNKDELSFLSKTHLLLKYSYLKARKFISEIKHLLVHFTYPKDKISNFDNRLDHLGRYDNRINPGDEKFWMDKFKKVNFV